MKCERKSLEKLATQHNHARRYTNMAKKVLLVSTSAGQMGEHPTGLWISELAEPYTVFTKAGFDVTIASSGSNEQGLAGKGGKYSKGDPWTSHVVVSGNLVTGQNPQSAEAFAQAVVKALA